MDGSLAFYDHWRGPDHVGEPVRPLLRRMKMMLTAGYEVRVFTTRASEPERIPP